MGRDVEGRVADGHTHRGHPPSSDVGHLLGCTGAKLTVQMLHELQRQDKQFGLVTMCIGGGMGVAMCLERP